MLECLTQYGPDLSDVEIAKLCHVSIRQVHCVSENAPMAWWYAERFAGERGWRFRHRKSMSRHFAKEPQKPWSNDKGTMMPGMYH
jgi:hypothetical protein